MASTQKETPSAKKSAPLPGAVSARSYQRRELEMTPVESLPEKESVQGIMGERTTVVTDRFPEGIEYFELKPLEGRGESKHYWITGGLKGAFTMFKVKPGMKIEIEHLGKEPFGDKGEMVNKYKIYELT